MGDLDLTELLSALDNESNEKIMQLTPSEIKTYKNNALQRLQISGNELKTYHKKLKDYRYVSDLTDIKFGQYIRWIPLKNPESLPDILDKTK